MQFRCKYCGDHSTLTSPNFDVDYHFIKTKSSRHGKIAVEVRAASCPNPDCKELQLEASLFSYGDHWRGTGGQLQFQNHEHISTWNLLPRSRAKPLPSYIPEEIRRNYVEACLICADSPKASAAMARRCLQGIVRDFWEIPVSKRGNLGAEISYIQEKIDPDTLESIIAVREVGDIGAHMEKAVDTIVDVEPEEADLLIELIETLLADWYVARHRKEQRNLRLKEIVEQKRDAKRLSKESLKQIDNKSDQPA